MILQELNLTTEIRAGADAMVREFVISNERQDMHRSIIKLNGWDIADFNRAGAFYYQHQTGTNHNGEADPDNALGPASAVRELNELIGIGKFEPASINEKAAKIMAKVDYGTLKSTSVGFMPVKYHIGVERDGEDPTLLYHDIQILKEFSIVNIPSNPDALKKYIEPMDQFIIKAFESHISEGLKKDIKREMSSARRAKYLLDLAMSRNYI
jgi:hypothetical protein